MPEYYADWWWEDLPSRAQKQAKVLGYSKKSWDADEDSPYEGKSFDKCTVQETHAARYLGMDPMWGKLDIWWEDADPDTKAYAAVLGYDQHKWDDDWEIHDLPCEHWNWADMSDEQKSAAMHFGYSRALWDETDEDDDEEFEAACGSVKPPPKKPSRPHDADEEEEGDYDSEASEEEGAAPAAKPAKSKTKKKFIVSQKFGGNGGNQFDHKNNRRITQVTVWSDDHCVNAMAVKYVGSVKKAGDNTAGNEQTMKLQKGEYIDTVTIRSNKIVQCLTFKTNKGNTLGPCGGKGWPRTRVKMDHEGKETTIHAPKGGYMLCGIKGGAGSHMDGIAFRWGPIPE